MPGILAGLNAGVNSLANFSKAYNLAMNRVLLLKQIIDARYGGNVAAFSRAIGKAGPQVHQWLSGHRLFGDAGARHVEITLHLPMGYFDKTPEETAKILSAPDTAQLAPNVEPGPALFGPSARRIPVVGAAQLGDNGHWADLEHPVGFGDGYIEWRSNDANAYALRCWGRSMTPRVKDGEFVIIEPNHPWVPGDEVMVKALDGRVMVKQFLYERDGQIHLASINETHGIISLRRDEIEKIHYVAGIAKSALWIPE